MEKLIVDDNDDFNASFLKSKDVDDLHKLNFRDKIDFSNSKCNVLSTNLNTNLLDDFERNITTRLDSITGENSEIDLWDIQKVDTAFDTLDQTAEGNLTNQIDNAIYTLVPRFKSLLLRGYEENQYCEVIDLFLNTLILNSVGQPDRINAYIHIFQKIIKCLNSNDLKIIFRSVQIPK